jgi:hypothetical protein
MLRMTQAVELGPVVGRCGPCMLYLKNMPCSYKAFLEWYEDASWLRRCCTRVYLFPPESPSHCAPNKEELLEKIIKKGKCACAIRLQAAPRTEEIPIGVSNHQSLLTS